MRTRASEITDLSSAVRAIFSKTGRGFVHGFVFLLMLAKKTEKLGTFKSILRRVIYHVWQGLFQIILLSFVNVLRYLLSKLN